MRIAIIIIGITAIATGLVIIRREDVRLRHEIQITQTQHIALRRQVWDRHMELAHLLTPISIEYRVEAMDLDLSLNGKKLSAPQPLTASTQTPASSHRSPQPVEDDGLPDLSN